MKPAVLVVSSYQDTLNAVRPEGALLIGLHRAGWPVTVITQADAPYAEEFRRAGLRVIDGHPTNKYDLVARRLIRTELESGRYGILHLYNNKAIVNGLAAARGIDVRIATYRGYTGNLHWWDPFVYRKHLHPQVDLITCVSPAVKEVFDRHPFFTSARARVVSKGHDPAWYADVRPADLAAEFDVKPGEITIGMVANARRMKGLPVLIKAVSLLPPGLPLRFFFIGRGLNTPANGAALSRTAYADRAHFTGFREDALSLTAALDISVLPSTKGEGLSKVLLESFFLARPTIMTTIGGNRHLGIDGQTCLTVPPADADALAAALRRLIDDPALRTRLGKEGRAFVQEHFSTDTSVRELAAAYEWVLGKG